jgi:phosphodiesterase/alkaline phosphatase D-like protein
MSDTKSKLISGPWSGAVTSSVANVKAVVAGKATCVRLIVSQNPDLSAPTKLDAVTDSASGYEHRIASFLLTALQPNTSYYYALEINNQPILEKVGQFRTFPPEFEAAGFKFVFASCAGTGSNSRVFKSILDEAPLFFCHMGDFHYENLNTTDVSAYLRAYDKVLGAERQAALYRHAPIARIWDDHDYCGDDTGGKLDGRDAAIEAFRKYTPHYQLENKGIGGIYQAFTVGRVRFLLCDMRSQRSKRDEKDNATKTMLGKAQRKWLWKELAAARQYDLVVWANSVPWIEEPSPDEDSWAGYHTERQELATYLKQEGVNNLCMISGDAHMLAIDDGRNSGYAEGRRGGFPVFHAAALKRSPKKKGGEYSEGAFKGDRQYGVFEVKYLDRQLNVFWTGKQYDVEAEHAKTRISYRFRSPGTYDGF